MPRVMNTLGTPMQVSKSRFKAHALEILRQIEADDGEVIITDHGRPSHVIRKYKAAPAEDALSRLHGTVLRYDDPCEPVGEEGWEAAR